MVFFKDLMDFNKLEPSIQNMTSKTTVALIEKNQMIALYIIVRNAAVENFSSKPQQLNFASVKNFQNVIFYIRKIILMFKTIPLGRH